MLFQADNQKRLWLSLLAAGAVLILTGKLLLSLRGPTAHHAAFTVLGQQLADQTAQVINQTGTVVVWRRVYEVSANATSQLVYDAFTKRLKTFPSLKVLGVTEEQFTAGPLPVSTMYDLPAAKFVSLLQQYPSADVLVLLGAAPGLTAEEIAQLPARRPKIVLFALDNPPSATLFEGNVIQVAIVPRSPSSSRDGKAGPPRTAFDDLFQIVTTENAAQPPW